MSLSSKNNPRSSPSISMVASAVDEPTEIELEVVSTPKAKDAAERGGLRLAKQSSLSRSELRLDRNASSAASASATSSEREAEERSHARAGDASSKSVQVSENDLSKESHKNSAFDGSADPKPSPSNPEFLVPKVPKSRKVRSRSSSSAAALASGATGVDLNRQTSEPTTGKNQTALDSSDSKGVNQFDDPLGLGSVGENTRRGKGRESALDIASRTIKNSSTLAPVREHKSKRSHIHRRSASPSVKSTSSRKSTDKDHLRSSSAMFSATKPSSSSSRSRSRSASRSRRSHATTPNADENASNDKEDTKGDFHGEDRREKGVTLVEAIKSTENQAMEHGHGGGAARGTSHGHSTRRGERDRVSSLRAYHQQQQRQQMTYVHAIDCRISTGVDWE